MQTKLPCLPCQFSSVGWKPFRPLRCDSAIFAAEDRRLTELSAEEIGNDDFCFPRPGPAAICGAARESVFEDVLRM